MRGRGSPERDGFGVTPPPGTAGGAPHCSSPGPARGDGARGSGTELGLGHKGSEQPWESGRTRPRSQLPSLSPLGATRGSPGAQLWLFASL